MYKIDPNGNLLFTKTSLVNFPRNFSSMRIHNDWIVMGTGSSTVNVAPVFVYNTDGDLVWTSAAAGYNASDVTFDENLNVYVLSSLEDAVSTSSGIDIRISKYSPEGASLWTHDYDFEGSEIATKFVYLNNRISVIGYGQTGSGAYFDWKTFQADADGNLLWYAIYDATTYNDEIPYHITAKPTGEVIVTGKGGPSFDPNNPSFIQMPIVEYSNTGSQIWVDTPNIYGGWGLATLFANDTSLYAISSSDMTVYHYNSAPLNVDSNARTISSVQIYPNPIISTTTIEINLIKSECVQITVLDIVGKILIHLPSQELQKGTSKINLDFSGLDRGLYICKIQGKNISYLNKLIKN